MGLLNMVIGENHSHKMELNRTKIMIVTRFWLAICFWWIATKWTVLKSEEAKPVLSSPKYLSAGRSPTFSLRFKTWVILMLIQKLELIKKNDIPPLLVRDCITYNPIINQIHNGSVQKVGEEFSYQMQKFLVNWFARKK